MPVNEDLVRAPRRQDWDDLRRWWPRIISGRATRWGAGWAMEMLILRAFELDGASVRGPYSVRVDGQELEQMDGALYSGGLACILECKSQQATVGIDPIAKLRNQLMRRPAGVVGMVLSTAPYSRAAVILAQFAAPQFILLWRRAEIEMFLRDENPRTMLQQKYRRAVEDGKADFDVTREVAA